MSSKILTLILLLPAFFLTSCLNFKPTDDPTRHYDLSPLLMPHPIDKNHSKIIGLARILIPEYLDRPKIIIEIAPNEYTIAEFHRWTEPLDRSISRVITQNLASQLPNYAVIPAPWQNLGKPNYELHINILDFKSQLFLCHTVLHVRYSIINLENKETIHSHEAFITVPLQDDYDEKYLKVVTSMDQALMQCSLEIASKINL